MSENTGNRMIRYHYDSKGNVIALTVNSTTYYYLKKLQNDIIALSDTEGNIVVEYKYNSLGKVEDTTGSLASTIGEYNPFRYRGYYILIP